MKVLQEITVPMLSVNDRLLTIVEILFQPGSEVKKGTVIAILETSKTTYSIETDTDGYIQYFCAPGDDLVVNDPIARIYEEKPELQPFFTGRKQNTPNIISPEKSEKKIQYTTFSNRALELLKEYRLDINEFTGYDFVNAEDIKLRMQGESGQDKKTEPPVEKSNSRKFISGGNDPDKVNEIKLSSNKLREIEYLRSVQDAGLVSVLHSYIELDNVLPFIKSNLSYFKDSLLPLIIFEVSKLLIKYPVFNAYYNNQSVFFHKKINVGFAIDIEKGLKVVKIGDTDQKSVKEIENEIFRLSEAYLDDRIALEELTNITFTITDLSNSGVGLFHPLINMRNAAILGISAIDKKLNRCTLSLAFDHRVTAGKQAAAFLSELIARTESFQSVTSSSQQKEKKLTEISCHRCMKTLAEDKSPVGFALCINKEGKQDYICQACFKGF
jgi:pyruvate/2-oxoglutarate dehydrogenase complex dihydrolipoamide acyltransferase (E2) component